MKTALIPPLGWESYIAQSTGVVMGLPTMSCVDSVSYTNTLKLIGNLNQHFLILDNGEAEGQRVRGSVLTNFAKTIRADEIVLPDVMGSRMETITKVKDFLRQNNWNPDLKYMGVAQGGTLGHVKSCIHEYAELIGRRRDSEEEHQPVTTLGIPRNLIKVTGEMSIRIDLANWIATEYGGRFEIHFLGASSLWPQEIKYAAKYAPHVRSLDTSLPFNYAIAGKALEHVRTGEVMNVARPAGYLSGSLPNKSQDLVRRNINTYLSWAEGK